jgi:Terminase large subunit, T4likevirus-type, N-terminal
VDDDRAQDASAPNQTRERGCDPSSTTQSAAMRSEIASIARSRARTRLTASLPSSARSSMRTAAQTKRSKSPARKATPSSSASLTQQEPPSRSVATIYLPALYPYQQRLLSDPARDACTVSATQVGKTYALAVWIVVCAMTRGNRAHPWWWIAPTFSQIAQGFKLALAFASSAGMVQASTVSPFPIIKLVNGATIEFRSWEREQNLAGTTIGGGVVDEAGLLTNEAQGIISTRRSATLGPLRYIGNPGVVAGPFRRLCALGEQAASPGSEWAGTFSLHRWTWKDKYRALLATNPEQAEAYRKFVEQERQSIPDFEFRRLYEAEWTEDEAAVFRGLDACIDRERTALLEPGSDRFVLGVDVAQSVDYLAAVSYGINSRRVELRYRVRGIPYAQAALALKGLSQELNATLVVEENGPGVALIQELQRLDVPYLPFITTAQSKQELILNLAADIQAVRCVIADHAPMPHEFAVYRYTRGPTGLYRYSAPDGEHDDTVMAAALARWGMSRAVDLRDYGWVA